MAFPLNLRGKGRRTNGPTSTNRVAWFRKNLGIASAASAVSQWDDQSGNARHLLQATGAAQPTLQGGGTILFDGTSDFMKCTGFTLNQPETVCLRVRQITWSVNDQLFDGNAGNTGCIYDQTASPRITAFAGTDGPTSVAMTLNTWASIVVVFNGVSSVMNINGVETTGDVGAANMGGFTLGAFGNGASSFANIEVAEVIVYSDAKDATARAALIAYLNTL